MIVCFAAPRCAVQCAVCCCERELVACALHTSKCSRDGVVSDCIDYAGSGGQGCTKLEPTRILRLPSRLTLLLTYNCSGTYLTAANFLLWPTKAPECQSCRLLRLQDSCNSVPKQGQCVYLVEGVSKCWCGRFIYRWVAGNAGIANGGAPIFTLVVVVYFTCYFESMESCETLSVVSKGNVDMAARD
jgi:hypothetical protein